MIGGWRPLLPEILDHNDHFGAKSPIFYPFSLVSAVTPSEKSSINTNRKSVTRFQWAQDEHRAFYLIPPKGWLKNAVSKIWTICCDNSETVRDRMSVTIILQ